LKAPALAEVKDWTKGCIAADPAGEAPHFPLADDKRAAIAKFAAAGFASLKRDDLSEFANRQIARLNCAHCHVRDGNADLYESLKEETAPLVADAPQEPEGDGDEKIAQDQNLPILTYAGEKLRPEWTERLLKGELDHRLRPWLRARMPAFKARATLMARGLPLDHGFPPAAVAPEPRKPELADIGKRLSGKEGGFACISCHGAGAMKPVGVFEAPGVNLQYVDERLTRHFYDRWMYNPLRLHKDTKMPAFADNAGKTSLKEVLDGDARRQFDAIYHYIRAGRKIEGPEN
jgi:mono/diheme cytochrome c family protein